MHWLRLIRWKNLLIVFFTQLVVWYCLIYDSHSFWGLSQIYLFLPLAVSTVLIAAAGYIINDYFDLKIDLINRPEKMVLEKKIPLRAAIIAHTALNITGLALAAMIAYRAHHLEWVLLQFGCIVLLWFYSTHFKRQFLTGNVVVAILTALTIVTLQVYEPAITNHIGMKLAGVDRLPAPLIKPEWVLMVYAFFAFMLTWMREIVKDMEDYIGDAEQGCITMPIKMGLQFSGIFTQVLGLITLLCLAAIVYKTFTAGALALAAYTLIAVMAPIAWWCFFITKKNTTGHYHIASRRLKEIMILGICSLIIYHFTNSTTH